MAKNLLLYGTLRDPAKPATAIQGYKMYNLGWYPGVRYTGDDGDVIWCQPIHGVSPDKLERLDSYEGYDPSDPSSSLYVRHNKGLEDTEFEIYEYNRGLINDDTLIPSGDWYSEQRGVNNSHMVLETEGEMA